MPTSEALDCSWVISDAIQSVPVAYGRLKHELPGPWLMPGPHMAAGSVQVVVPFGTTFQPWLVSSALALAGL